MFLCLRTDTGIIVIYHSVLFYLKGTTTKDLKRIGYLFDEFWFSKQKEIYYQFMGIPDGKQFFMKSWWAEAKANICLST